MSSKFCLLGKPHISFTLDLLQSGNCNELLQIETAKKRGFSGGRKQTTTDMKKGIILNMDSYLIFVPKNKKRRMITLVSYVSSGGPYG